MIVDFGDGLSEQIYKLGETELIIQPQLHISTLFNQVKCPLTYSYYIQNKNSSNWALQTSNFLPFSAFDTSNGQLSVFASDPDFVNIYTIKLKIEDPISLTTATFIELIFDLAVVNLCVDNELKSESSI